MKFEQLEHWKHPHFDTLNCNRVTLVSLVKADYHNHKLVYRIFTKPLAAASPVKLDWPIKQRCHRVPCSLNRSPRRLLVSPMYTLLHAGTIFDKVYHDC